MNTLILKKNNTKQYLIIMCIVLSAFMLITAILPQAYADDAGSWESMRNEIEDKCGVFGALAWDVGTAAAGYNPNFNLMTIAGDIYKISSYSGSWALGGTRYSVNLIDAGKAMYEVMKVVGLALIFLYFLIEILDEVQSDHFNIEHLIKKLLTLTIALIVLNQGADIFNYICQLGDALINDVHGTADDRAPGDVQVLYQTLIHAGDSGGIFSALIAFITCVGIICDNAIPFLFTLVAYLIAYLTSFSRFIEILVRFTFAPVGCASLVSGGSKGPGMRYIKKFASCVLQGAVAVMAFGCVSIITQASNELNEVFSGILLPLTLIGFISKVGRIADDIVGV